MAKIVIDLLPVEFKAQIIKTAKFYKIQAIGVAIILFMTFLASLTVALRVLQNQQILQTKARLTQAEEKISDFKSTQASVLLLKNRLTTLMVYLENPSKPTQMYQLITELVPASFSVNSIAVATDGELLISAVAPDSLSLDKFITDLLAPDKTQGKISLISLENINRGREGIFRVSLKIKPK